jgi:hypothetical protein
MQVRLAGSDTGAGKSGSMAEGKNSNLDLYDEKTQVTRTRYSTDGTYTAMGTGFLLLRIRIQMRIRLESFFCAVLTVLHLSYDSTNYAGPVSPLLTLVVLPEAGFISSELAFGCVL